jgi:hypothetical protein
VDGGSNNSGGWIVGLVLLLVYGVLGIVEDVRKESRRFYRQVREKLGIPPEE